MHPQLKLHFSSSYFLWWIALFIRGFCSLQMVSSSRFRELFQKETCPFFLSLSLLLVSLFSWKGMILCSSCFSCCCWCKEEELLTDSASVETTTTGFLAKEEVQERTRQNKKKKDSIRSFSQFMSLFFVLLGLNLLDTRHVNVSLSSCSFMHSLRQTRVYFSCIAFLKTRWKRVKFVWDYFSLLYRFLSHFTFFYHHLYQENLSILDKNRWSKKNLTETGVMSWNPQVHDMTWG